MKYFGSGDLIQFFKSFRNIVWSDDFEADGGEGWEEEEYFIADDIAVGIVQIVFPFIERQREDANIVDLREAFGRVLVMIPSIKQRDEGAFTESVHGFAEFSFSELFIPIGVEQWEKQMGISVEATFLAPFCPCDRK